MIEEKNVSIKMDLPEDSVLKIVVKPHLKKSRGVKDEDINTVVKDSKILYELCFTSSGLFNGAFAMHHSQINDKDPLDFFVTADRKIVVNPVVLKHSNYTTDSKEGCMSFPDKPQRIVPRWHKMEVEYQTIMVDPENKDGFKLSSKIQESLAGKDSFVWQHEIDHSKGIFIY